MNSDEKIPGGGSGGGGSLGPGWQKTHGSKVWVDGEFTRASPNIVLMSEPSPPLQNGLAYLAAMGDEAKATLISGGVTNVVSGYTDPEIASYLSAKPGVNVYTADGNHQILIQLGRPGDPCALFINVTQSDIRIDAGATGTITLAAGGNAGAHITIKPDGIEMKGQLIQIN